MESIKKKSGNSYTKFFIMLALSFMAMYVTMYLNTYALDHVYFSMTRFYMACLGISVMGVIMLLIMKGMYIDRKKYGNSHWPGGSGGGPGPGGGAKKTRNGDVLYMKGMIPHHSIAILTSERADIKDPEVKKLAGEIIAAQRKKLKKLKNDKSIGK
nr:DUF305 domain-containing protein [Candidatus Brachybacter algidus]